MRTRRNTPTVPDDHNGRIHVRTAGPLGWFLALTSGLPRNGTLTGHLELREGPDGQRWTRHLKPGRRLTSITWNATEGSAAELTERLGPVALTFHTRVEPDGTKLDLHTVRIGPIPLGAGAVRVRATASTETGELVTRVEMHVLGRLGRLSYTSRLDAPHHVGNARPGESSG